MLDNIQGIQLRAAGESRRYRLSSDVPSEVHLPDMTAGLHSQGLINATPLDLNSPVLRVTGDARFQFLQGDVRDEQAILASSLRKICSGVTTYLER
ncbi:hypothetical protein [Pseudomonas fluorescens]|uniref:hypothetical protein n=1 Tax=Pseudomonas fluorescens TaxID=294 RepID=UPI00124301D8|nr:hypothetical protein [Pseudomonas fluorescens]